MVADVQTWLNTPSQNHGWIIIGTETQIQTSKRFGTRENTTPSSRPSLTVNYTPSVIIGACCNGSTCTSETPANCASPRVYKGDGSTCSPNPCVQLTGACCASNGTCSDTTQTTCQTSGGTYLGDATSCSTSECPIVLTKYMDPLPLPAVATPASGTPGGTATYNITIKEIQQRLHVYEQMQAEMRRGAQTTSSDLQQQDRVLFEKLDDISHRLELRGCI